MIIQHFRYLVLTLCLLFSNTSWAGKTVWSFDITPSSGHGTSAGFGVYHYPTYNRKPGIYANFQVPGFQFINSVKYTEVTYNNQVVQTRTQPDGPTFLNVGLTKKLSTYVKTYAGVGVAGKRKIETTYPYKETTEGGTNLNAGIIIGKRFTFNIGIQSFTQSLYFGIGQNL